jgi:hypothetical protein
LFWALGCGVGRGQLVSGVSWSQGSAGLRGQLIQKINNKKYRKTLRSNVIHAIIKSNRSMAVSTSAPGSAISKERVIPIRRRSVKCGLVDHARKERDR